VTPPPKKKENILRKSNKKNLEDGFWGHRPIYFCGYATESFQKTATRSTCYFHADSQLVGYLDGL